MIAPRVVHRHEWGAVGSQGPLDPGAEPIVVVHHTASPHLEPGCGIMAEANAVLGIERFHIEERGWLGIGYNWLVAPSGNVFEGRGWKHAGAHAAGVNRRSIGMAVLMDAQTHDPTDAAIESLRWLIAEGMRIGELSSPDVTGHRDHGDTACPGDRLYSQLGRLR